MSEQIIKNLVSALKDCVADSQSEVDRYVNQYGERYRIGKLFALRETVTAAHRAIKEAEEYLQNKQSDDAENDKLYAFVTQLRWLLALVLRDRANLDPTHYAAISAILGDPTDSEISEIITEGCKL